MLRSRHWFAAALIVLLCAPAAFGRVLSYSPYSDRNAFPALQHRMNRHFVIIEAAAFGGQPSPPILAPVPYYQGVVGQMVLYDFQGLEEPRVIFPQDGSSAAFSVAAVREDNNGVTTILIQTNSKFGDFNPQQQSIFLLSTDSGASWTEVSLPKSFVQQLPGNFDLGGPYARSLFSPVRIGNADFPFVVDVHEKGIFSVLRAGVVRLLYAQPASGDVSIIGSDRAGTRFLVRTNDHLYTVDLDSTVRSVSAIDPQTSAEGWITPSGGVYLQTQKGSTASIWFASGVPERFITWETGEFFIGLFAIPAFDYEGAWILQRAAGKSTSLFRHTPSGGLAKQWDDITSPQVEALHAGASGDSLMIQVHRPREQADQRLFLDPALAIWHVGEIAPRAYDELFMNEQYSKGFVHLDVDAVENGEAFVFDSGAAAAFFPGPILSPSVPGAGGSDVIQEWGVVRASLRQRLILPGVARLPGAFNSYWLTDIIIYNPLDVTQKVTIRYVPTGEAVSSSAIDDRIPATVTLAPREIRVVPDALKTLFGADVGGGALTLTPEAAVSVTSRTYTQSSKGTFGFGMNAIDMFNSVGPRFPVTFSGAFQGPNFRTNLLVTDVSGRGGSARLTAAGSSGIMGSSNVSVDAPANGVQQFNDLRSTLGLSSNDTGALRLQPSSGQVIPALVAIDNRTNDPTYFPPDLPSPFVRTIPAIGHLDGANNSKFRSDLFLYNPTATPQSVILQAKLWDTSEQPTNLNLTLLGNEARVIRDVLLAAFGKTGIARLRYTSMGGVRVTARTYNINDEGGTYGFLTPPLNNFQIAGAGDTLEILGAVNDSRFRTNIGLVELSAFATGSPVLVEIEIINQNGVLVDSFTTNVAPAGGRQIDDIFTARGLKNVEAALIRISPIGGMIGAYGAFVDNGTNDPTYVAANLAAK